VNIFGKGYGVGAKAEWNVYSDIEWLVLCNINVINILLIKLKINERTFSNT
jgi:hypothetical protein